MTEDMVTPFLTLLPQTFSLSCDFYSFFFTISLTDLVILCQIFLTDTPCITSARNGLTGSHVCLAQTYEYEDLAGPHLFFSQNFDRKARARDWAHRQLSWRPADTSCSTDTPMPF
jgi:hypothetical protein